MRRWVCLVQLASKKDMLMVPFYVVGYQWRLPGIKENLFQAMNPAVKISNTLKSRDRSRIISRPNPLVSDRLIVTFQGWANLV